jgi:hypothetical protein
LDKKESLKIRLCTSANFYKISPNIKISQSHNLITLVSTTPEATAFAPRRQVVSPTMIIFMTKNISVQIPPEGSLRYPSNAVV